MNAELFKTRVAQNLCGECGQADERTRRGNGRCESCSGKAIAEYVAYREKHGYSEEELFEMRAAFGPGEKVVNVLTGQEIQL